MVLGFEFFGFGSKRRTALQTLDRALAAEEVNPAYVDDGMRYLIYKWAEAEEAALPVPSPGLIDQRMREAAALISFCVLGPAETCETWDAATCAERQRRFDTAVADGSDANLDARIIKLVLAKGAAAPDIRARVSLE
jgi:hypothetical protein